LKRKKCNLMLPKMLIGPFWTLQRNPHMFLKVLLSQCWSFDRLFVTNNPGTFIYLLLILTKAFLGSFNMSSMCRLYKGDGRVVSPNVK
jgi:hypothetical protein